MKTTRRQVIHEVPWGMWVWQFENGEFAGDDAGNFMHVFVWDTRKQDVNEAAKNALRKAVKTFGFADGEPVLWQGKRPITDEQLEEQIARAKAGLVADPLDIGAIRDEERALRQQNG